MRDWIISLFNPNVYGLEIGLFDLWHIGYLLMVVGVPIALTFLLKNKSQNIKRTVINVYLIAATVSYALDFILVAFGEIAYAKGSSIHAIVDKFPFHICTLTSILACFGQFNARFKWLKKSAIVLSVVAPLMYCCYPGTALGDISPLSYKVTQTFFYHGCLFAYGMLSITLGGTKLDIKKCWHEAIALVGIALWAGLGNYLFNQEGSHHYDWFFLTGSTFPFIPVWLMPFAVVAAIFCMVLIIYGIYYLVLKLAKKQAEKVTEQAPEVLAEVAADEAPAESKEE